MENQKNPSGGESPAMDDFSKKVSSPLWDNICEYIERTYLVQPKIEYSSCAGKPGFNVKYRKSGRALCTLYPDEGYFTCLVAIGGREALEAEHFLLTCDEYVARLYAAAKPYNGTRWLMIEVTSERILEDVKALINIRVKPKAK